MNGKYDEETDSDKDISYLIYPSGHGALYHYNQIAYYLLLQRGGGNKLKEIEGSRWVWLYENKKMKTDFEEVFNRKKGE